MLSITPFDTIAAISTSPGEAAIGIVKISGEKAFDIINKIFQPYKSLEKGLPLGSFTMHLGYIKDKNMFVDEVLVSFMKAPHTYTREDIVEINCHGGAVAINEVLKLVLENGARLAERGEFTKRAFINGRIDLSQAEAVLDVVRAKTNKSLDVALKQLKGNLKEKIEDLTYRLKDILVILEANIDFAEEDVSPILLEELKDRLLYLRKELDELIKSHGTGKIFRDGVLTVISGKPNVGKSSILNSFLKYERAIVTEIPGTTRDVIEEQLNIEGIPFILADTAGITITDNLIEKKGIKKSKEYIEKALLILLIFDGSEQYDERDIEITKQIKNVKYIPIINKVDLPLKLDKAYLKKNANIDSNFIYLSAKNGTGLKELERRMAETVFKGETGGDYSFMVANTRHYNVLKKASSELNNAITAVNENREPELIAFDIKSTMDTLGEISGVITNKEIIDEIFNDFCIGK